MQAFLAGAVLFGVGVFGDRATDDPMTTHSVTASDDDRVTAQHTANQVVFSIRSPSGIGRTAIPRPRGGWPESVVLRLHLKGLEFFSVKNDTLTLAAAVSSQDGKARIWQEGQEHQPLDAQSPLWFPIRGFGPDGKPVRGLPPDKGYWELQLPRSFLKQKPDVLAVRWIDFYRN
ncbi:MAG: hypothetical protein LC104_16660 [Bacteroidales bacterium]|nr:hypothetical protein [Bacteroidales bacterium]